METQGIYCAIWTAASAEGEVLWQALDQQLGFVLEHQVDGLMVLGTTGNFHFFDREQRTRILQHIAEFCRARGGDYTVPLIANVSDVSLNNVVYLGRHARDAGAAAMAVLPPWYYPASQPDLTAFFIEAARRVSLPLALYNYPEVTGKRIDIDTLQTVARSVPVHAFKQSGGSFDEHSSLLPAAQSVDVPVFTGWDTRLSDAFALGVKGSISGLSNAVPEVLTRLWKALQEGRSNPPEAEFMTQLASEIAVLSFPHNIRAAIEARGLDTGEVVNPVSPETASKYQALVERLKDLYRRHGLPPAANQH